MLFVFLHNDYWKFIYYNFKDALKRRKTYIGLKYGGYQLIAIQYNILQ